MASEIFSKLQLARQAYKPPMPSCLATAATTLETGEVAKPDVDVDKLAALFPATFGKPLVYVKGAPAAAAGSVKPIRVGCLLSGGQAPGGHNVISGLYDFVKRQHPDSKLYGFLDGPRGLYTGKYVEIDDALIDQYRQMGGFDIIGSGRDKIETPEQFSQSVAVAGRLGLDGIVVAGGDDSNTNAALLAGL
jgi:diphosphate-dependent phosphofructokinase